MRTRPNLLRTASLNSLAYVLSIPPHIFPSTLISFSLTTHIQTTFSHFYIQDHYTHSPLLPNLQLTAYTKLSSHHLPAISPHCPIPNLVKSHLPTPQPTQTSLELLINSYAFHTTTKYTNKQHANTHTDTPSKKNTNQNSHSNSIAQLWILNKFLYFHNNELGSKLYISCPYTATTLTKFYSLSIHAQNTSIDTCGSVTGWVQKLVYESQRDTSKHERRPRPIQIGRPPHSKYFQQHRMLHSPATLLHFLDAELSGSNATLWIECCTLWIGCCTLRHSLDRMRHSPASHWPPCNLWSCLALVPMRAANRETKP